MEPIAQEIGSRIRRYRLNQDLTQEALAEKAELHHTYIGQVERGEKNLTISSLGKILTALGVSFSELFENIEETKTTAPISTQCYRLISNKSIQEQEHLYHILLEIEQMLQA